MISLEKVLGTSKVGPKQRITLVKEVQDRLKVQEGDLVVFVEDDKGNIIIKVTKLKGKP